MKFRSFEKYYLLFRIVTLWKWPFWWNKCHVKIFMLIIKCILDIIIEFFIESCFVKSCFDRNFFQGLKNLITQNREIQFLDFDSNFEQQRLTLAKSITIIFIISSSKSDSSNWNNFSNFHATNDRRPGTSGLSSSMWHGPCPLISLPQNEWPH